MALNTSARRPGLPPPRPGRKECAVRRATGEWPALPAQLHQLLQMACAWRVHGMCTACAWHVHWRVQEQRTDLRPLPDTGAGRGAAGGLAIGETVILLTLPLHHY